jgi:hypothetical protein
MLDTYLGGPVPSPVAVPQYPALPSLSQNWLTANFPDYNYISHPPRLGRNQYGYIDPISDSPKVWQAFLYYGDAAAGQYAQQPNGFAVARVTITEQ